MNARTSKTTRRILLNWTSGFLGVVAVASQVIAAETNHSSSFELGIANMRREEVNEAIRNFTDAIHSNPKDALAYQHRGAVYFLAGEFDNSIDDLTRSIQLRSSNPAAYLARGSSYCAKHQLNEAIQDFSECLRLAPTNDLAYYLRGVSYFTKAEFDKAINDWNEGLRLARGQKRVRDSTRTLEIRGDEGAQAIGGERAGDDVRPDHKLGQRALAKFPRKTPSQVAGFIGPEGKLSVPPEAESKSRGDPSVAALGQWPTGGVAFDLVVVVWNISWPRLAGGKAFGNLDAWMPVWSFDRCG